jgi:hypothetical protein
VLLVLIGLLLVWLAPRTKRGAETAPWLAGEEPHVSHRTSVRGVLKGQARGCGDALS